MSNTRFGLVAAGLAAALAAPFFGCSGSVNTGTGGDATTCPATEPVAGTACSGALACSYGAGNCPTQYTCNDGTWGANIPPCLPPTCPAAEPTAGSPCDAEGLQCPYTPEPGCNEVVADATCTSGAWDVSISGPGCIGSCAPPTPVLGASCSSCCLLSGCKYFDDSGCVIEPVCTGTWTAAGPASCPALSPCMKHGNQDACAMDPACRWLVEAPCGDGIGTPPPFPQGCYPAADCVDGSDCTSGGTCLQVQVDPCPGADCNACVTTARICVP